MKQSKSETLKRISGRLKDILVGRESRARSDSKKLQLLVVDGEESICFSMKEYFTLHHYNVQTANDLDEAERLYVAAPHDVVIQDLRLGLAPQPEGIEMVKFIRAQNAETRIIVLTAYGSAEMEAEAMRCGADAFLRKPKPLRDVAQVIQGLIDSPPRRYAKSAGQV